MRSTIWKVLDMKNIEINYTAVTATRGAGLNNCLAAANLLAIEKRAHVQLTHDGDVYWTRYNPVSDTVWYYGKLEGD